MGHERLGALPHTLQWRSVVAKLTMFPNEENVSEIADSTISNVQKRFQQIHQDTGVIAAFKFLIALSRSSVSDESESPYIDLSQNPSPLRISAILAQWINANAESLEYANLAQKAAIDTIAKWTRQQKLQQPIFPEYGLAVDMWRKSGEGREFCNVARMFFAKFTEGYLKYFLDREASAVIPKIQTREKFSLCLEKHIDLVSNHAFETARITQSFAAGWYNNHARRRMPTNQEIEGFLGLAFGKIREELKRESVQT